MQVFISWSGERASHVGEALKVFLDNVFAGHVKTFFSPADIAPGDRFEAAISSNLGDASLGILLITPENQISPWLLFEAGALALKAQRGSVMPILIDLPRADLLPPLNQFQNVAGADRAGFEKVCARIRKSVEVPDRSFDVLFEDLWPALQVALETAAAMLDSEHESGRSLPDMVQEILLTVNSLARREARRASTDDARRERQRRHRWLERARQLTANVDGSTAGARSSSGWTYSWAVAEFPRNEELRDLADIATESGFIFQLQAPDGSELLVNPPRADGLAEGSDEGD